MNPVHGDSVRVKVFDARGHLVVGVDSRVAMVFKVDERDLVVEEDAAVGTVEGEGRAGGVQVAGDSTVDLWIPEP